MTSDERREFLRRMSVGLGAVAVAACGGGGGGGANSAQMPSETPVPPAPSPSPGVAVPAPDPGSIPAPPSGSPVFRLSGGRGENVLLPFCLGQVFRQGAFPQGANIGCGLADFQASVLNRWPDGSAKFALLAGRAGVAEGATRNLTLSVVSGTSAGANVTESQLQQTGVAAALEFAPYGTVQLQSLLGVTSRYDSAGKRWTAGMVRQNIAGPQMSSWTYYSPIGAHPHLSAWFEVRCWSSGQVQILPWIENGYLKVAGPTSFAGTLAFSLNGTQRFSAPVTLPNHTRTAAIGGSALSYWHDASATGLQYTHDTVYWQQTALVPTYTARVSPISALLSRQKTAFTPLMQGDFSSAMGSGGYHGSIGLLPEWDVAYLASNGDARALAAVLVHGLAAGRYPLNYRDETTNQPIRFSSYPDLCLGGGDPLSIYNTGTSTANQHTPGPTGVFPAVWASSHHPSVGYMAYLVSGWSYFAEQVQFCATLNYLKQGNAQRGRSKGLMLPSAGANTTRGAAWALRTLFQAATVTPDAHELRAEFIACVAANVDDYHQKYIAQANNPYGICAPYSDYTQGDGKYMHAMWMEDFLTAAWGYALSLRLPLDVAVRNRLEVFFQWKARSVVGRFGRPGVENEYNYLDAAQYTTAVAPSDTADFATGKGPWYADWGAIYAATLNRANDVAAGDQLRGAFFPETTSYWGNLQPALAYAVDHGVPAAAAAYTRMSSARNWPQFLAAGDANPVWSVRPAIGI